MHFTSSHVTNSFTADISRHTQRAPTAELTFQQLSVLNAGNCLHELQNKRHCTVNISLVLKKHNTENEIAIYCRN